MSKATTPFFALGAQGSVGGVLSARHSRGVDVLEKKPVPTDPQTLRQIYQRWDYLDCAFTWGWQSTAVKQEYASAGVRYHLTGFQYWMRYWLRNLPWHIARYHLDNTSNVIAYDTSKRGNNGTIFGTTLVDGIIDGARYFDGINDHITVPHSPTLTPPILTVEFFVLMGAQKALHQDYISKRNVANNAGFVFRRFANTDNIRFYHRISGGWVGIIYVVPDTSIWHHFHSIYDTANLRLFVDGVEQPPVFAPGGIDWDTNDLEIGTDAGGAPFWTKATLDEVVLYHNILEDEQIIEHSQRRYPL